MTRANRLTRDLLICGTLALGLTACPPIGWAEEPGPAALSPPEADAPQIEQAAYWRARGDAAREKLTEAQATLDAATAAVSRMQRRNHPRGEARLQIRAEREEAQADFDAALHILEVELPAEARAGGAPRHWLNERG